MSKIIKNETKITSSLTIKITDAVEVETKKLLIASKSLLNSQENSMKR